MNIKERISCKCCRYSHYVNETAKVLDHMECRHNPPGAKGFPNVESETWCGEFSCFSCPPEETDE